MLEIKAKNKRFDPENSFYHNVIYKKYLLKGYRKAKAYAKARKEFLEGINFGVHDKRNLI